MDVITGALSSGLDATIEYVAQHVITCLVPAFFIAGAIAALIKKEAILRYFGRDVRKYKSYSIASVSGTVLAVCSCTILPLFAGIYKKGGGIGPATTFLFAGPAINVLAIIYTAQTLGFDLGLARAVFAILISVLIGIIMSTVFKDDAREGDSFDYEPTAGNRPGWVTLTFFALMVTLLIVAASGIDLTVKLGAVYVITLAISVVLIYGFERSEVTEWGLETWDLTKKIFPILLGGTFVLGMFAYFVPPESFSPYLGNNDLASVTIASLLGSVLYMPTLLEVPIIGSTLGYTTGAMAAGPALTLLLSGPTTSLPSLVVLNRIFGLKRTLAYWLAVVLMTVVAGLVYGFIV